MQTDFAPKSRRKLPPSLKKNRDFHRNGGLSSQNRNATRYLDPKYSRWMSADPAVSDYMDKTKDGEGGIYNFANLNLYHYSNNNPIIFKDPNGKKAYSVKINENLFGFAADANIGQEMVGRVASFAPFGEEVHSATLQIAYGAKAIDGSGIQTKLGAIRDKCSGTLSIASNGGKVLGNLKGAAGEAFKTIGDTIGKLTKVLDVAEGFEAGITGGKAVARDNAIADLFGGDIKGSSHENVSALYAYAGARFDELVKNGDISYSATKTGGVKNGVIHNPDAVKQVRTELQYVRTMLEEQQ